MDITIKHYLARIRNSQNKTSWKIRKMVSYINTLISEYRLTAMKFRGYVRKYSNAEANLLERELKEAMKNAG